MGDSVVCADGRALRSMMHVGTDILMDWSEAVLKSMRQSMSFSFGSETDSGIKCEVRQKM